MKTLEEEPPLNSETGLPGFIDVLLYPVSLNGIIQIGICLFFYGIVGVIIRFVHVFGRLGALLALVVYLVLAGYVAYYFGYCVFDSSRGGRRAPGIWAPHAPDMGAQLSQLALIVASVTLCFLHVGVYYGFTRRIDLPFWLLCGLGAFLFPMTLLAVVLFDTGGALNPVLIIGSIVRTFVSYCGLILSFCAFGGLIALAVWTLGRSLLFRVLWSAAALYLLLVAAHLLGRFYWLQKDKLEWDL